MWPLGSQEMAGTPYEKLIVDFSELRYSGGYMVVLVCTITEYLEAYLTQTEKPRKLQKYC